ncbi:MAG TPA: peptidylprolyl isomerase [Rariglobus sp.]|jgi:cyclophilin family peptidyl-prolyl cis-trans isomerase|nr:peptidylprolyl isomerase [Rariglobus sp.]
MRLPLVLILAVIATSARADSATVPEVTQTIPAQALVAGTDVVSINLADFFDVAGVSGQVVQLSTGYGKINVEMLADDAPNTVTNFLSYVNSGAYNSTLFHRSIPGFVLQTGGYFLDNGGVVTPTVTTGTVDNEFDVSNTRGTLAMAKVDGDPDSATSQWFFNLADNSTNLDSQNGGFTVFARVLGTGMTVVDTIAALQSYDVTGFLGDDFSQTPLQNVQNGQQNLYINNLVLIYSAQVVPICPSTQGGPSVITFGVESTNPTAAPAFVSGHTLNLPKATATAAITVRAEDSNGNGAESTFIVGAKGVTVGPGKAVVFRVPDTVSTFQWQRLPAGEKIWADITDGDGYTGTTTAVLTVPANLAVTGDQYHCTVTTAGKKTVTKPQLLTVDAFATVVLRQTSAASIAGAGAVSGTTYFAKGLPAGLTINASTGQITGQITAKPGVYTVTTWSQNGSVKSAITTRTIVVQAFVSLMTGSFEGLLENSGAVPIGKVELLVSATGAFTGKLTYGSGFVGSLKGMMALNADSTLATTTIDLGGGVPLALTIDRNNRLMGTLTIPGAPVSVVTLVGGIKTGGYNAAQPAPWQGTYAMVIGDVQNFNTDSLVYPSGAAHAAVTIANTGVMQIRGKLADGTVFTGSCATDFTGTYRPFIMPYKRAWSFVAGFLPLSARGSSPETYHVAAGTGSDFYWLKNAGSTDKLFPAGFGLLGVNIGMEPWTPPADVNALVAKLGLDSSKTLLLLVSCTNETLDANNNNQPVFTPVLYNQSEFNTYGLPVAVTLAGSGKTVTLTGTGASPITAKVNLADGSFTGTISLAATGSTPARVLPFEGSLLQLINPAATDTVGQGYFLLPGAAKTDPTLGGLIKLAVPAVAP